jgi:hypothetical protein
MNREKVKLIIRNMELLLDSLKAEIYSDSSDNLNSKERKRIITDYDEIFEDEY